MQPRIPLRPAAQCSLSIQTRSASILGNLRDNPGAHQKRIRVGRGPSSGYGKTSGRGHKGQKQHGKVKPWFQGGQTSLMKVWGKKGFVNHRAPNLAKLNLDKLQQWIDSGRIDPTKQITVKEMHDSGLVTRFEDGIKLLARGKATFTAPVDILVSRASAAAIDAVEQAGGKIVSRYYTKQSIRRLIKGESISSSTPLPTGPEHVEAVLAEARKRPLLYRLPDPTSRDDMEYYRDPAHRGYLSHMLQPGESPSLYFRVPGEKKAAPSPRSAEAKREADPDRIF